MLGLDPITLTSVLILVGAQSSCPSQTQTQINVIPMTQDVKYDYNQSLKKIQQYSMDTVDPYGFHGQTITQGFMQGQVELKHKVEFKSITTPEYGPEYGCIWYDEIKVEIEIDPKIVIANELYRDPCMRNAITRHELKHVRVDREVVNKYSKTIGAKLLKELSARGYASGPIPIKHIKNTQQRMARVVQQIISHEYQKLILERRERQGQVDSLEEYESVDDKCPAFNRKKKKIYSNALR